MHRQKIKNKAQEEIIGFVVIMLVVAVIFVIFLGIYISKNSEESFDSSEISQFLDSAMEFTTECSIYSTGYNYLNVQQLFIECQKGSLCYDGQTACEVLEITLTNLTESAWSFGQNRPEKGYEYEIIYESSTGEEDLNPDFKEPHSFGLVGGEKYKGASPTFSVGSGNVIINLKIYSE